jgi:hypothetical protein
MNVLISKFTKAGKPIIGMNHIGCLRYTRGITQCGITADEEAR